MALSPLATSANICPRVPAPAGGDDDDDCGAVRGMRLRRGDRITWRINVPQRNFRKSHMTRPGIETTVHLTD